MITNHQRAWMKEFLMSLCESEVARRNVEEILETVRKLWHVAQAAKENPYQQSPKLKEALEAIKPKGAPSK